ERRRDGKGAGRRRRGTDAGRRGSGGRAAGCCGGRAPV
ncbi:MAG: hypothetical protein AVDCRST_MAG19-2197, partial [uncultured Thermomicrobiales bacterium]